MIQYQSENVRFRMNFNIIKVLILLLIFSCVTITIYLLYINQCKQVHYETVNIQYEEFDEMERNLNFWIKKYRQIIMSTFCRTYMDGKIRIRKNRTTFDEQLEFNTKSIWDEQVTSVKAATSACQIPKLDPFHPDVMKFVKKFGKKIEERCPVNIRYGSASNGKFRLKISGVQFAMLYFVRLRNDFVIDMSHFIYLTKVKRIHLNKKKIGVGCLFLRNELKIMDLTDSGIIHRSDKCEMDNYFQLEDNGNIRHIKTKKCIKAEAPVSLIVLSTQCNNELSKFIWTKDDVIKLKLNGLCIGVRKMNGQERLILVSNCSSKAAAFDMMAVNQDLDINMNIEEEFMVLTIMKDDKMHHELHIQALNIAEKDLKPKSAKGLPVNVAMVMFDSQSRGNFIRHMPKTMKILEDDKDSFIFKGHTIVGDGTTAQLCAMLVGALEGNLPEARRGIANAQSVDKWPFIFKDFHDQGYTSLYSEDASYHGIFQYRLLGWNVPPTHHYARAFWMMINRFTDRNVLSCFLGQWTHQINFNYMADFLKTNKDRRKFSVAINSELCHRDVENIRDADHDIYNLIKQTKNKGFLNNTILILFGDHGARDSEWRSTLQGKIEERLPFFTIVLPTWIRQKHPEIVHAMKENTGVLTSHFDVYATLKHILSYPPPPANIAIGQSLFTKIWKENRTCESAGVAEHWCPCLQFEEVIISDIEIKIAKEVVDFINNITKSVEKASHLCSTLVLQKVIRAGKRIPNKMVQQFVETSINGFVMDKNLPEKMQSSFVYEITFSVLPSNGEYEANVYVIHGNMKVDPNISRTNTYADQPKCIHDEYPYLRKYCYCK